MRSYPHPDPGEITLAGILSALGDPVRLSIVGTLADGEEHQRGDYDVGVSQSTLSHHMRTLREAGVTRTRAEGTRCYVALRPELAELFPGLVEGVLAQLRQPTRR